jgi:hypothetical protein
MLKRWRYVVFEWRRLPGPVFLRLVRHAVRRALVLRARRAAAALRGAGTGEREILAAIGARNRADGLRRLRDRRASPFFVSTEQAPDVVARFRDAFPGQVEAIIAAADRALRHEVDLLGSGPTRLGEEIDWHRDIKSGFTFPKVHHSRVPIQGLPRGVDIKVPWELSRCQDLVPLGQAYWLTGNEAYAREIKARISSWIAANPAGVGCNWVSAMEVAIRAANWAWAYTFIRHAACCDGEFLLALFRSLADHGRHIERNLERTPGFAGNHYLADLAGLAYLGLLFPELPRAAHWRDLALRELEREIRRQVLPDGADFEASIPYHRLATELLLFPYLLFRASGIEPSAAYTERLAGMIDFAFHYMTADGHAPPIGDGDDGRLHVLAPLAIDDHRYLAAVGAALFGRSEWRQSDPGAGAWAFWVLAGLPFADWTAAVVPEAERVRPSSRAFRDTGVYVLRHGDIVLVADAGGVGQEGKGGHAHHDALSVTLSVGGTWVLRDPGTGVYFADPARRTLMRSTTRHNTVQVDGLEQGTLLEGELFLLGDAARPTVEIWETGARFDRLVAYHDGYARPGLPSPVRHRREIYFDKERGVFRITDMLEGRGAHVYRQALHLSDVCPAFLPGARAMGRLLGQAVLAQDPTEDRSMLREDLCRIPYPDFRVSILYDGPPGASVTVGRYEYAETYGVFAPGTVLEYQGTFEGRARATILILIER